jgi:hypothetical protein
MAESMALSGLYWLGEMEYIVCSPLIRMSVLGGKSWPCGEKAAVGLVRLMVDALRIISSLRVLLLPIKKNSKAPRTMTLSAPTLIPAMVPALSFLLLIEGGLSFDEVALGSGDEDGVEPSEGNGSPGFNMYEEESARERWVARETVEFYDSNQYASLF